MVLGYDYNLDLLGVRFDAECELRAMHELAEEIANYWKLHGSKEDFKENCLKSIREKISYEDDVNTVWRMIREDFNWE